MDDTLKQLSRISTEQRILLLPHCLRQSATCKAKYNQLGLQCIHCNPACAVNRLTSAALRAGYKGVCVAPGGRLAVNYVKENKPQAIVAVACSKELNEGIEGVRELVDHQTAPLIVVIPLTRDGCVDTQVDVERALEIIDLGSLQTVGGNL
jgi:hypothetical protein